MASAGGHHGWPPSATIPSSAILPPTKLKSSFYHGPHNCQVLPSQRWLRLLFQRCWQKTRKGKEIIGNKSKEGNLKVIWNCGPSLKLHSQIRRAATSSNFEFQLERSHQLKLVEFHLGGETLLINVPKHVLKLENQILSFIHSSFSGQ